MKNLYVNIYKGVGGNKNVFIVIDEETEGRRIEVKEGETPGSVIDRFLEENFTENEVW